MTKPRANRRITTTGYPVGEETRQRVMRAAIGIFGQRGFQGTSTREIAAGAGVKPPALQYYFGSKLGLYCACVDLLTTRIWAWLEPAVSAAQHQLLSDADVAELIETYCGLQDRIIDTMFLTDEGKRVGRMLQWEDQSADTSQGWQLMRNRIDQPLFRTISPLVGRIIGSPPNDLQTGLHTVALSGLFMVFHLDGSRIHDTLGWRPSGIGNVALLRPVLRMHATALLESMAGVRDGCMGRGPAGSEPYPAALAG